MFCVMNEIKKGYILDSILEAKDDPVLAKKALGNLVSFSIEHGINGNLYKKYILYTLIYNDNSYTRSIEMNQKTIGQSNIILMDYQEYFELYNKEFEFLNEAKYFQFKREEDNYLASLLDSLYNEIEKMNNYHNFVRVIESFYKTKGLADMAIYKAFRVDNGILKPIKNVLNVTFNDLIGYDMQKSLLCENTEFFLNGKPYNNVLLYGDAGTGKSTSVKALINKYFDKGLRIIEVYKHQMAEISKIINKLKSRPYHYVIYMDDLSFEENEIEYKYLKSIIEGGIEPKPENVVIYATSNRRHLIKETISDNGGVFDDLHRNETQAEKLSLSYRFGLQIYYSSLSIDEFRSMVKEMAIKNNIIMDEEKLIIEASKWQMRNGTLSGRCAEQFIKYLSNKIQN
ncbi:hypothetical protein EI71_01583 [Anaeroplasma bactoclasticum]|uniref:Uncharacterized protein n=2 Tax=Anaeroplasma bactoclasticum TaxID=2088 RepID=A0A397R989_9MOLU|nr:hypothetical protein EI71_01583 [Anaeroplasma bactoclasticum]